MLLPLVTSVFCSGVLGRTGDSSTSREYASTVTTAGSFWTFISDQPQISMLQNHVQQNSQFRPHPTLANIFCRTSPYNEVKKKYITHGPSSGSPQTALISTFRRTFPIKATLILLRQHRPTGRFVYMTKCILNCSQSINICHTPSSSPSISEGLPTT
jgi:hypothetical protein